MPTIPILSTAIGAFFSALQGYVAQTRRTPTIHLSTTINVRQLFEAKEKLEGKGRYVIYPLICVLPLEYVDGVGKFTHGGDQHRG